MKKIKWGYLFFILIGFVLIQINPVQANENGPTITLNGEKTIVLESGIPYEEFGATASDAKDGDITNLVKISGSVNSYIDGTYTINYTVSDSDGNKATEMRNVIVISHLKWNLTYKDMVIKDIIQMDNGDIIGVGNMIIRINQKGEVVFAEGLDDTYYEVIKTSSGYQAIGSHHLLIFDENGNIQSNKNIDYEINSLALQFKENNLNFNKEDFKVSGALFDADGYTIYGRIKVDYNTVHSKEFKDDTKITYLSNKVSNPYSSINIVIHVNHDGTIYKNYFFSLNDYGFYKVVASDKGLYMLTNVYEENDKKKFIHLSYNGKVLDIENVPYGVGYVFDFQMVDEHLYILSTFLNNNDLILSKFDDDFNLMNTITLLDHSPYQANITKDGRILSINLLKDESTDYMEFYELDAYGKEISHQKTYDQYSQIFACKDGYLLENQLYNHLTFYTSSLYYGGVEILSNDVNLNLHTPIEYGELVSFSNDEVQFVKVSGEIKDEVGIYHLVFDHKMKDTLIRTESEVVIQPIISGVSHEVYYHEISPFVEGGSIKINHKIFKSGKEIDQPGFYFITIEGNNGYYKTIPFVLRPVVKGLKEDPDLSYMNPFLKAIRVYRYPITPEISFGNVYLNGKPFTSGTKISKNGEYYLNIDGYEWYHFIIEKPNYSLFYTSISIFVVVCIGGFVIIKRLHQKEIL